MVLLLFIILLCSSISPKPERKIKPLCSNKITNSMTPVGTVQPTTRTVQPPKCTPSTSKQVLPLPSSPIILEIKDEKKRSSHQIIPTTIAATNINSTVEEFKKKLPLSSLSSSISIANKMKQKK